MPRYRCTACGETKAKPGRLHAHIDAKHRGVGPFNLLANPFAVGDPELLDELTEVVEDSHAE